MKLLRGLVLALWVLALVAPASAEEPCSRIVAIGDLHGDAERFRATLRATGLVDEAMRWQGGSACLVQIGDILDRGEAWPDIVRKLRQLEEAAPGRVHVLMGNHEAMNLLGDWRYLPKGDVARYASAESEREREEAYARWSAAREERGRSSAIEEFDARFPPGWFARRRDFSPEGEMGRWILERPLVLRLGETLFVHGGLSVEDAELGLEAINQRGRLELEAWLRFRDYLVERGVIEPFLDYPSTISELAAWLVPLREGGESWAALDDDLRNSAVGLAVLEQSFPLSPEGPLWNRALASSDNEESAAELSTLLYLVNARRLVAGHTPQKTGRIEARYSSRVFLIDTSSGAGGAEGASALVIEGQRVSKLEAGELRVIVPGDRDVERWLAHAQVVEVGEAHAGITKPYVVTLQGEGLTSRALFKYVDERKQGPHRERNHDVEMVFTDSYKYERAAYLLDRHLGLGLLPVAVLRNIEGREGALVQWIEGAITEKERLDAGLHPAEPMVLLAQREEMRVFDALILNTDRTLENQLTRTSDWRLCPIDHSRSFRLSRKLPPGFEERPIRLTRGFFAALEELEQSSLRELIGPLLTRQQIRSLLKRRDRIIDRVRRDLQEYGESFVFLDAPAGETRKASPASR